MVLLALGPPVSKGKLVGGVVGEALAIVPPDSPQAFYADRVALNLPVRLLVEAGMIFHQHLWGENPSLLPLLYSFLGMCSKMHKHPSAI